MKLPGPVGSWLRGLLSDEAEIEELAGDASTNLFYRARTGSGTWVLMLCAEPDRLPSHVHMNRLFESLGLPVAHLIASDSSLGSLLMEDLGDRQLCDVEPSAFPILYSRTTQLITKLQFGVGPFRQRISTPVGEYRPPVLGRNRLLWELEFFATHYLFGIRHCPDHQIVPVRAQFHRLLDLLRLDGLVYCHRDYHSRNMMVKENRLYLIDVQDARWGHPLYDLVSLLCDCYVDVPFDITSSCKSNFRDATRELWSDGADFERQYDFMAIQRSLKAIGTFAAQARLRGKTSFLPYIPLAKRHVRERIARPELSELHSSLNACGFFEDGKEEISAGGPR